MLFYLLSFHLHTALTFKTLPQHRNSIAGDSSDDDIGCYRATQNNVGVEAQSEHKVVKLAQALSLIPNVRIYGRCHDSYEARPLWISQSLLNILNSKFMSTVDDYNNDPNTGKPTICWGQLFEKVSPCLDSTNKKRHQLQRERRTSGCVYFANTSGDHCLIIIIWSHSNGYSYLLRRDRCWCWFPMFSPDGQHKCLRPFESLN